MIWWDARVTDPTVVLNGFAVPWPSSAFQNGRFIDFSVILVLFSAKTWDEFIGQLQQKFKLQQPVLKNYRIDYQLKDRDGKVLPECYGLTENDEFQYALSGIGYQYFYTLTTARGFSAYLSNRKRWRNRC